MKRKTFAVPDEPDRRPGDRAPFFSFGTELRDTSKPVMFNANGQPVYAPRGYVVRWRD